MSGNFFILRSQEPLSFRRLLSILNRKKFRDIDLKELAYCYRVYELVDQPVYRELLDTFHALVFDKFADEDEWEEIVTRNKDIWLEVIIEKSNAAQTRKFYLSARKLQKDVPWPEGFPQLLAWLENKGRFETIKTHINNFVHMMEDTVDFKLLIRLVMNSAGEALVARYLKGVDQQAGVDQQVVQYLSK